MSDANSRCIRIGESEIGSGRTVYVVAEAGVNHNGELKNALALVEAAASAGADAVKFQAFRASALVTRNAPAVAYQQPQSHGGTQYDLLRRLEMPPSSFAAIQQRCRIAGVEFLATPFGVDDLAMLIHLDVHAIKIASPDLINMPLLEAAAHTGRPMILSTGAAEPEEIDETVEFLTRLGARERLAFLHCVSSYPTELRDANLRRIAALAQRTGCPTGYSDHTQSLETGMLATAAGALIIEKHFTLDRKQPGPDHAFSLEPDQLAEYIAGIRKTEVILGSGQLQLCEAEQDVRKLTRSSVVASENLPEGKCITRECLAVKRPGTGIRPADFERVVGKVAARDIPADTPLQWEMLR